jgi:hypothetical protein
VSTDTGVVVHSILVKVVAKDSASYAFEQAIYVAAILKTVHPLNHKPTKAFRRVLIYKRSYYSTFSIKHNNLEGEFIRKDISSRTYLTGFVFA